ncbi:MAG: hypothetical protein ABI611_15905 [Solirubrobacteraceae bacterium]
MPGLAPNLDAILADLRPAVRRLAATRRRRRRVARSAGLSAATVGLLATAALGASAILGRPAPESVKRDLRAVDRGMPADLRRNPDVESAHAVAVADGSTVYFAQLADGGYCAELVTGDRARGAVCSTAGQTDKTPIGVTVPFTDPIKDTSPVTVSGRVSVAGARVVQLVYPDQAVDEVPISPERFYVAEVPEAHLAAVHRRGLLLIARDADGKALAQAVVPADAITPPTEAQRPKDPIEIDTISDGSDLTRMLGVRGTVQIPGVTRLRLRYPDGHSAAIALKEQRYRYDVPRARQRDFATRPGTIEAIDARGAKVGERMVASVAFWRRRNGG